MAPQNATVAEKGQSPEKEVSYNEKSYNIIREGLAEILVPRRAAPANGETKPKSTRKGDQGRQTVFYNPIQQYNRDLSVLAIRAFADDLAAVRKAKQQQKEQALAQGERRGKKRKRGAELGNSKRSRGGEEKAGDLVSEALEYEDATATGTSAKEAEEANGDGLGHGGGEQPGTSTKGPEEYHENGHMANPGAEGEDVGRSNDAELKGDAAVPAEVEATHLALPNGSKKHRPPPTQPLRILDALSASGLRALRYAKEIPAATQITANDLSSSATSSIKQNITHNALSDRITTTTGNAIDHMHDISRQEHHKSLHYNVIDLDPYGTAVPFLDTAVQAVTDGGLLCVTCTDAGVFASIGYLEKTYSQYGGLPIKGPHAHEAGLRLILHAIASTAARYGIAIEPLLSLSIDFYARVFVKLHKSPAEVKFLASKTMLVYQCDSGCGAWETQYLAQAREKNATNGETWYKFTAALGPCAGKECEHCGFRRHVAGPMWGGALHNPFFVQRILDMLPGLDREVYKTVPRIEGMLSVALEEELDDPWASIPDSENQPSTKPPTGKREEAPPPAVAANDPVATSPNEGGEKAPISLAAAANTPATTTPLQGPIPRLPPTHRNSVPFFVLPPTLARILNAPTPSDAALRGALHGLNYRTTRSHTKPGSIVTDAPWAVIWEVIREWARVQAGERGVRVNPGTAGEGVMRHDRSKADVLKTKRELREGISSAESVGDVKRELEAALYRLNSGATVLNSSSGKSGTTPSAGTTTHNSNTSDRAPDLPTATPPTHPPSTNLPLPRPVLDLHTLPITFDEALGSMTRPGSNGKKNKKLVRYQMNPAANWGPLSKAKGGAE